VSESARTEALEDAPGEPLPSAIDVDHRRRVSLPAGRAATPVGGWLARVGGMRPDLVDEFPAERRDFIQMAFVLFTTATMAVVSGAFAINMAFLREVPVANGAPGYVGPHVAVSIAFGLVWGLVIFNIDRYMVLGMEGLHHTATLVPALLRVALAALIGVVMSTPLVLQIFSTEIQLEMLKMQQEATLGSTDNMAAMRRQLTALDAQVATSEAALTQAQSGVDPEGVAAYNAAVAAFTAAGAACTTARTRAELESRGDLPRSEGGSDSRGRGDVWVALDDERRRLCGIQDDRESDKNEAAKSTTLTPEEQQARIESEQATLTGLRQQRVNLLATIQKASGPADGIAKGSFGLITRLLALERLTSPSEAAAPEPTIPASGASPAPSSSPSAGLGAGADGSTRATGTTQDRADLARLGHWSILGLLTAIEILPVLFKTIKQWPKEPTPYECRWRDIDTATVLRTREIESRAMDATRLEAFAPVAAAEHMQRMQQHVSEQLNREIAEVQLKLMQKSLAEWATDHGVTYSPAAFIPEPLGERDVTDPPRPSGQAGARTDGAEPHHPPTPPAPVPDGNVEGAAYLNS